MNRRPSGIVLVLSLMGVFMFTSSMSVIGHAEGGRTLRIVDYATGLNNTKLGNETEPIPAGGRPFAVSVILDGETSDLATWQVKITFDNNSIRCTSASIPEGDPSYVFYGKAEISAFDLSMQDWVPPQVVVAATLLFPNQAVTISSATLCLLNFTALRQGNFTLSFIINEGVAEETFLLDSIGNSLSTSTAAFSVALIPPIGTVYIRADGSIDPPDAPISSVDNVTYTLTGDVTSDADGIVVERDNIVIDGAGYTLHGIGSDAGINLKYRSNTSVKNIQITNFGYGIWLAHSSNNSIVGNDIANNSADGIWLDESSNYNSLRGNNVTANNWDGVHLYSSSDNALSGNNVTANNYDGIALYSSSDNALSGNNVTANNEQGIWLSSSSGNTLSDNLMVGNRYTFGVVGDVLSDYLQSVDTSNLVDGKPVYYFVNQSDLVVNTTAYPEVGYLGFVNCANVIVQQLNLTGNCQGLLLAFTNDSKITSNNVANNSYGIYLSSSSSNTLSGNNVTANKWEGIVVDYSSNNTLSGNNVAENIVEGIKLYYSSNNTLSGNNVTAKVYFGIDLISSSNNSVFHNSFSVRAIRTVDSNNIWDDGFPSGGNYWSYYNGADSDHDGIGDSNYTIDTGNVDRYPLMGMFSEFDWVSLASPEQRIQTICNSTISNLIYNDTAISFDVFGNNGTSGFCRIQIPKVFMNSTFAVFVNGTEIAYTLLPSSNENYTYLYFNYTHSIEQVIIIPEFPSFLILPLFLIATLLAVIVYRKKHAKISGSPQKSQLQEGFALGYPEIIWKIHNKRHF